MSVMSALPDPTVVFVDSVPSLIALLNGLERSIRPGLYIDLEGIEFSRHGSINIFCLYLEAHDIVYLIDVHTLGKATFSTASSNGLSLKIVLEFPLVAKVFFDVRNDSDALFAHYQISLDGVGDIQLMELATRRGWKRYLASLNKCIANDAQLPEAAILEWQKAKQSGACFFDPSKGGRCEVLSERPLRPELITYCAQDVMLLPRLLSIYKEKLGEDEFWWAEIDKATKERIKSSQSVAYAPHGQHKALGPWDDFYIDKARQAWRKADAVSAG